MEELLPNCSTLTEEQQNYIMNNVEDIIKLAREALAENNAKEALKILKPLKKSLKSTNANNLQLIEAFIEIYLENGGVENAYPLLVRSCELDPQGQLGGSEKFFTLGQITGGEDGIKIMFQGVENISQASGESLSQEQINKIIGGLLSMIEIWMTDLCMEPNAESQCEELIQRAMEISDKQSPEAWAMLGSIRISQQRYSDACASFIEAWKFFEMKKQNIENHLLDNSVVSHRDYIELLQPLLSLIKMCIEMGLYDVSLKIINAVKDIEEDNLENYYLEGFANYMLCKLEMFKMNNTELTITPENIYEFNEHFEEVPLDIFSPVLADNINEARIALSFAAKVGENCDNEDGISQEILTGIRRLLQEVGGPISTAELMKIKKGENVEEADYDLDIEEEIIEDN